MCARVCTWGALLIDIQETRGKKKDGETEKWWWEKEEMRKISREARAREESSQEEEVRLSRQCPLALFLILLKRN